MYLHQRDNWWDFSYDSSAILGSLVLIGSIVIFTYTNL